MNRHIALLILTLLSGILMLTTTAYGQVPVPPAQKFLSSKYQGIYSYSKEDGMGLIYVYPETDTTMLFYLDLVASAANKRGSLYGRIFANIDSWTFETNLPDSKCKWEFNFYGDSLSIRTLSGYNDCSMGAEASADGSYKKLSGGTLNYFTQDGKKVYFDDTKPEDFHKKIALKVQNDSGFLIRELKLKNAGSSVSFRDIGPGNISGAETLSIQGDSGILNVQLWRKRFLRSDQLIIINKNLLLAATSNEQDIRSGKAGTFILRIDIPGRRNPVLKTALEKQPDSTPMAY